VNSASDQPGEHQTDGKRPTRRQQAEVARGLHRALHGGKRVPLLGDAPLAELRHGFEQLVAGRLAGGGRLLDLSGYCHESRQRLLELPRRLAHRLDETLYAAALGRSRLHGLRRLTHGLEIRARGSGIGWIARGQEARRSTTAGVEGLAQAQRFFHHIGCHFLADQSRSNR
jgi:hypothetical protein